jgi:hypothetical protein
MRRGHSELGSKDLYTLYFTMTYHPTLAPDSYSTCTLSNFLAINTAQPSICMAKRGTIPHKPTPRGMPPKPVHVGSFLAQDAKQCMHFN